MLPNFFFKFFVYNVDLNVCYKQCINEHKNQFSDDDNEWHLNDITKENYS